MKNINQNEATINLQNYGWNHARDIEWQAISSRISPLSLSHTPTQTTTPLPSHPHTPSQPQSPTLMPVRITLDHGERFVAVSLRGEVWLNRPTVEACAETLAVGDWLAVEPDVFTKEQVHFHALMQRTGKFSRSAAGSKVKEQILATNIDTVFLVQSLNHDFNMKRLERYLIAAWECGAQPVVVLTKSDLCEDDKTLKQKVAQVHEVALGVDCVAISALTGSGLEALSPYMSLGKTIVLLGSSGVGKSTLVNTLVGKELLATQEIRDDDSKGKHTTTHRELVLLDNGAVLIDTPGMRSFSPWEAENGIQQVFGDVEALMRSCQYSNCDHKRTAGCAVQSALKKGELNAAHYENWLKLEKEQRVLTNKLKRKEKANQKQQDLWKHKTPPRAQVLKKALYEYSSQE